MGSFNHSGNLSRLPITYGDRIVVLFGIRTNSLDIYGLGSSFIPVTLPIRGTYDDYGGIENVDRTPCIEFMEKVFGMKAEKIVETAERVQCGCGNQVEDRVSKIKNTLKNINPENYYGIYGDDWTVGYFMEHESVFDKMSETGNEPLCDFKFYNIPDKYLEELGYKKELLENTPQGDVYLWKHDKLPTLKQSFFLWVGDEYENYSKTIHNLSELTERIGVEMPEYWKESFLKCCFENDIKTSNTTRNIDDFHYTFKRVPGCGRGLLNYNYEACSNSYCSIFNTVNGEHLKEEYRDEFVSFASFIRSMQKLFMNWGITNNAGQENDYKSYIEYSKECLRVAESKQKECESNI